MYDFNGAGEQREREIIPEGTIATVHMTIRPGTAGEGGWFKRSKDGSSQGIDAEFTVVDGPFAKRKFWKLFTMEGTSSGHQAAGEISASQLRAILESARGVRPDDESENAKKARRVESWGDFDGLRFIAKIGIEKGKGEYKDKNSLDAAITPDRTAWHRVEQVAQQNQAGMVPIGVAAANVVAKAAPAPAGKPSWAQ
jgi:hypothetical protein